MKVAITSREPDLEGEIDEHFGRCKYFIFVENGTKEFESVENQAGWVGSGAGAPAAYLVKNRGATVVLTGHVGPTAAAILRDEGIEVYSGLRGALSSALEEYEQGKLTRTPEATVDSGFGKADASIDAATYWQDALDRVAEEFEIHTIVTDPKGAVLATGGEYNPLCTRIRETTGTLAAVCSQTSAAMLHEARTSGKPQCDYCEAGLLKTVVPVFVDGVLVHAISACGLAVDDEPPEAFLVSRLLDIDEDEASRLMETVKVVDGAEAERVHETLVSLVARRVGSAE